MRKSSYSVSGNKSKINTNDVKNNQSALHPRKVQGRDFLKSTLKSNFEKTILDLKNKPAVKSTEEEYLNGLQEQIKFLEYELKLLKDKQLQQRSGLNELDNFLKDQIPINENILAMKNKYNSTKMNLQTTHKKLVLEGEEAAMVLSIQKDQIKKFQAQINNHKLQLKNRKKEYKEKCSNFEMEMMKLKCLIEQTVEDNKRKQEETKAMNDEIMAIYRQNDKQKISQVRRQDQKQKKSEKLRQSLEQTKQQTIITTIKIQQLQELGETNPLISQVQSENVLIKKKLMINQKQKNTSENRIAEIDLFLDEAKKERQQQRVQKLKLTDQIESFKLEMNNFEKNVEDLIKKQLKYHKNYLNKKLTSEIEQKDRYLMLYGDRLKQLEQDCEALIQQKKQLNQNIEYEDTIANQKRQKLRNLQKKYLQLQANTASMQRYEQITQKQITPLRNQLERTLSRIPIVTGQISKKMQLLQHFQKEVQLIKELKNLNLQEVKLMRIGGSQIQEGLQNFLKKWQKIKSSNSAI